MAALVYCVTFAAVTCYPTLADPVGIAISLPYALLNVGVPTFIIALLLLITAPRAAWRRTSFVSLSLAVLITAVFLSVIIGYAMHPRGAPCAI